MDVYTILMLMVALLFPQDTFFNPVRHCGLYPLAEAISLEKDKEIQFVLIASAKEETDFGTDYLKYENHFLYMPFKNRKPCGVYIHWIKKEEKCNPEDYVLHTRWMAKSILSAGIDNFVKRRKFFFHQIEKVKKKFRKINRSSFYKEYKKCD
jgi:hypothetical protein